MLSLNFQKSNISIEDDEEVLKESNQNSLYRQSRFKKQRRTKPNCLDSVHLSLTKIRALQELELKELENYRSSPVPNWMNNEFIKLCLDQIEKADIDSKVKLGLELFIYRTMGNVELNMVNGICVIHLPEAFEVPAFIKRLEDKKLNYRKYVKFSGMPVRLTSPVDESLRFTASFFKSGKVNLAGLRSAKEEYLDNILKLLKEHADLFEGSNRNFLQNLSISSLTFKNRVFSVKIPALSHLKRLQIFNGLEWRHVKYNDQAFPGGVYVPFLRKNKQIPLYEEKPEEFDIIQNYKNLKRLTNSNMKVIFFRTGSCIFVGIKTLEELPVVLCKFIVLMIKYHLKEAKLPKSFQ